MLNTIVIWTLILFVTYIALYVTANCLYLVTRQAAVAVARLAIAYYEAKFA